jgi:phage portal protein BeeE
MSRLIDRLARRYGSTFWEGEASGASVLTTTYGAAGQESLRQDQTGWGLNAYSGNGIVFGAILARMSLFSEVRFQYQALDDHHLFGSNRPGGLTLLEHPWPNGTTGELLSRMIQDADLAGNCYLWNTGQELVRLPPQQVTIVSQENVDPSGRTWRSVIGYWWDPTMFGGAPNPDHEGAQYFTADEIAHWSPIPDPTANWRGMSWLTPVIREITADVALTDYKIQFLNNAATPNILLKYKQKLLPGSIDALRERMAVKHGGMTNAFKTLVLDQGADATIVGNTFEQMNFTTVQAAGENRIIIASGVPGIVIGSKEGLMAATYSNYAQAMRRFADITMRPLWRSVCACLASIVDVPAGSRLWYDTRDIAALQDDNKQRADVLQVQAAAIGELARFGWDPESIIAAVTGNDLTLLKHPGPMVDIMQAVPKASPVALKLARPGDPASPAVPATVAPLPAPPQAAGG